MWTWTCLFKPPTSSWRLIDRTKATLGTHACTRAHLCVSAALHGDVRHPPNLQLGTACSPAPCASPSKPLVPMRPAGTCTLRQTRRDTAPSLMPTVRSRAAPLATSSPRSFPPHPAQAPSKTRGEEPTGRGEQAVARPAEATTSSVQAAGTWQRGMAKGSASCRAPCPPQACISPHPVPKPSSLAAPHAALCRSVQPEGAHKAADLLDSDGLPHVGGAIWPGQPYYSTVDKLKSEHS